MKEPETIPSLIVRARQGSPEAAGQLYERHYQSIYRYLVYRTADVQTAEDLTGEVFLRMVQSLPTYRQGAAEFRSWLFQIARNLSIDHYRRARVRSAPPIEESLPADEDDPEDAAQHRLTSARLMQAVTELTDEQRDVVLMRFVAGMPVAEVAATLHKSEDAVKGLQRRALINLRGLLEPVEEKDDTNRRPSR